MGWLASIGVAIAAATAGAVAAGVAADAAVSWYHISSFEGGAGYFVVLMALAGLAGGGCIGLVAARVTARRPGASVGKALATALAAVLATVAAATLPARLLADVPPRIAGEELWLHVELRWSDTDEPMPGPAAHGRVRLGATAGSMIRVSREGPLFLDAARRDEGRLVVPGVVHLFTSRGDRVLDFVVNGRELGGFIAPVPARPGPAEMAWSPWYPESVPAESQEPAFTFRYRVGKQSEPVRADRVGPFVVETIARDVSSVADSNRFGINGHFRVRHDDAEASTSIEALAVSVVGDGGPLLIQTEATGGCLLLSDTRAAPSTIGPCGDPSLAHPLTNDQGRFAAARTRPRTPGWVDRETFTAPGLYLAGDTVFDTRTLSAVPITWPDAHARVRAVPPLAVSPDESTFVWFAYRNRDEDAPALALTRWRDSTTTLLPVVPSRMRYPDTDALDPAWVTHHFAWQGESGAWQLAERAGVAPLPYRGTLTLGEPGEYQLYRLRPAGEPLRAALVALMVEEWGGERLPDEYEFQRRLRLDGIEWHVTVGESPPEVFVSAYHATPGQLMALARRLDAALATGRFDALFTHASEARTHDR